MTVGSEHVMMVALAGLLEGIGVPWPGAVVVAAAGVASGGSWPDLLVLAAIFGLAYSLGSLGQYTLGRVAGQRAMAWMPDRYRNRLTNALTRYGLAAVLLSRPLTIGNYISAPAGVMRMPLTRFLPFTFLGVSPWALGMLTAGDAISAAFGGVQALASQYLVRGAAGLLLLAVLVTLWKRSRRAQPAAAA